MQHIFIVGAKSLGTYGGFETFVNKLTEYHQKEQSLKYHIACKANGDGSMNPYKTEGATIINDKEFIYHNAHCFRIKIPEFIGPAQAIYYDLKALDECINIIKKQNINHPIVYILACRIGPFMKYNTDRIHQLGGKVFINPDGHEWMRAKWSLPIKKYWKKSEELMVKYADLVICDSINIEKYIHDEYDDKCVKGNPKTTYIAYGADVSNSTTSDEELKQYLDKYNVKPNEYFLIVGRFVPENNYETMIREFMKTQTKKDLVIITNTNNKFYNKLKKQLHFTNDKRIKFIGTVYNEQLLKKIRENAFAYIHGHEVGGTNPSLLEALASTNINLLLDVGFNREVAGDAGIYWKKNNLCSIIDGVGIDNTALGELAKNTILSRYSWGKICGEYLGIFEK